MNYNEALDVLDFKEIPSIDDLKKRYRELSKKYHPDSSTGSDELFKKLNNAYALLQA